LARLIRFPGGSAEKVNERQGMVIGAGALATKNQNLALDGHRNLFIVDFDQIEAAIRAGSVLFRESDNNRSKAEIAGARAKSNNPDIHVRI